MIAVAGPWDKKWKGKNGSSLLVSEVFLLPPTSASMGEAERWVKHGLSSFKKRKKVRA